MNCKDARELINLYLDDELTKDSEIKLQEHIKVCPSCREEFKLLSEVKKMMAEQPETELPENFHRDLMNKINKIGNNTVPFYKKHSFINYAATAAAAIVITIAAHSMILNYQKPLDTDMSSYNVSQNSASDSGTSEDFENNTNDKIDTDTQNNNVYSAPKSEVTAKSSENKKQAPVSDNISPSVNIPDNVPAPAEKQTEAPPADSQPAKIESVPQNTETEANQASNEAADMAVFKSTIPEADEEQQPVSAGAGGGGGSSADALSDVPAEDKAAAAASPSSFMLKSLEQTKAEIAALSTAQCTEDGKYIISASQYEEAEQILLNSSAHYAVNFIDEDYFTLEIF